METGSAVEFGARRLSSIGRNRVSLLNLGQGDCLPPPPSPSMPPKATKPAASSHAQASHFPVAEEEELWYACAGPQHALPPVTSLVAYFPQGHIEQVASFNNPDVQVASFNNPDVDGYVPRYHLPAAIPCTLNDILFSADPDTDEVFATLTLCPVDEPTEETLRNQPVARPRGKSVSFTKTLTVSDTSTHGGFSVPRRGAEDCFPPLDKSQDNPIQDLIAKDLHGNEWKFRHLFRGQPKRHLLTTGWSVFVSQKRLVAGDAVLFLRDGAGQLRIAVRLAPRQQKLQSLMVTTPTMAIGVLEAAAHAASEQSRFTLIYNPRSCPSQFVIPYSKYVNAVNAVKNFAVGHRVKSEVSIPDSKCLNTGKNSSSVGSRSRTRFESDDSSDCRYTGTISDMSDYDHGRWPGSVWRSIKVNWDEPSSETRERISPWEISPFTPRTSLPPQDRTRRRYKPSVQLPMVQQQPDPAMPLNSVSRYRPDPVPSFAGLPGPGLQDLLGFRCLDINQGQNADFGMQVYRAYKSHCDLGSSSTLPPSSPRQSSLHSFINAEPFSATDLQLRVSSPAAKDQASSKFSPSHQQPSLAALRDPQPGWPSYRSFPEAMSSLTPSRTDDTLLSMSNQAPESGSSGHPLTPKSNFWDKHVQAPAPVQKGRKCRIFGVSLDRPATPEDSSEASSSNRGM